MEAVLPPLERLLRELRASNEGGDRFRLAILSDTPDGPSATQEEEAVERLARRFPDGAVRYRRRLRNDGYKAGNLMDFLDRDAEGDDFLLVLDADSTMSAAAVRRLVRLMQADPGMAILQPTVGGHRAETLFARHFGFGHRHGTRIWATGQAWWQGPDGAYWGHNALIRIAPFRAHARLPVLPGGELILSHDYVEAALLHEAGWAVRVLPEDAGSFERHPPDLLAHLDRDRRWAAGNLQYRHLLRRQDLSRVGRLQMLQAILHYALTPFWFALLPLAAINAAAGGAAATSPAALIGLLLAASCCCTCRNSWASPSCCCGRGTSRGGGCCGPCWRRSASPSSSMRSWRRRRRR
jgi:membrane glycosyltransferase